MQIELTPEREKKLHEINSSLNHQIVYVSDEEQFGVKEDWDDARNTGKDDCDGFAMAKHMELIEAGFPEECLGIATCVIKDQGGHAVNVVSTDRGDLVLDNRYKWIMAWDALTDYEWDYVPDNVKDGANIDK